MISFLFWNLNKKPLWRSIAEIAELYQADVLMFTECLMEPAELLVNLNSIANASFFYAPGISCDRIKIYTRFSSEFMGVVRETDRLTVRHLTLPGLQEILLAVIHFPSKLHMSDISQAFECTALIDQIRSAESSVRHSRTILVGDLNMNPFEDGIVTARGLHAMMSRAVAGKGSRFVQGAEYQFFFNPMWQFFGDDTPGPPGTYYYDKSEQKIFFWNIFDQVLVRPALLPLFNTCDVEIVASDGRRSLLKSGKPDKRYASDHLPLVFKLNL